MDDTWANRDLPVLDAVVSQVDKLLLKGEVPEAVDIAAATGIEIPEVVTALNALVTTSSFTRPWSLQGGMSPA